MNRLIYAAILLAFPIALAAAQGQKTSVAAKPKPATTFTEKVLKFLGISASSSTFKGPGDEVVTGNIWLADLQSATTRSLTSTTSYRSPIFLHGSNDVLALRGRDVVQISPGGAAKKLCSVEGITKLVGGGLEDRGKVIILLVGGADGRPRVALLNIGSGATTALSYDSESHQDLEMVESLQAWTRTYGDAQVYVQSQSKQAFSGTVQWTDVFLRVGDNGTSNISHCDGTNCGQPSLSEDRRLVVFVKSQDE